MHKHHPFRRRPHATMTYKPRRLLPRHSALSQLQRNERRCEGGGSLVCEGRMLADGGSAYGRGQRGGGWEEKWTRWQALTTGGAGGGGGRAVLAGHLLRVAGRGRGGEDVR